jgi:hypothetical protein
MVTARDVNCAADAEPLSSSGAIRAKASKPACNTAVVLRINVFDELSARDCFIFSPLIFVFVLSLASII